MVIVLGVILCVLIVLLLYSIANIITCEKEFYDTNSINDVKCTIKKQCSVKDSQYCYFCKHNLTIKQVKNYYSKK